MAASSSPRAASSAAAAPPRAPSWPTRSASSAHAVVADGRRELSERFARRRQHRPLGCRARKRRECGIDNECARRAPLVARARAERGVESRAIGRRRARHAAGERDSQRAHVRRRRVGALGARVVGRAVRAHVRSGGVVRAATRPRPTTRRTSSSSASPPRRRRISRARARAVARRRSRGRCSRARRKRDARGRAARRRQGRRRRGTPRAQRRRGGGRRAPRLHAAPRAGAPLDNERDTACGATTRARRRSAQ